MSELLYTLTARFIKLEEIGNLPKGYRRNAHFMGDVAGQLSGKIRGIDYVIEQKGVTKTHIHEVLTTDKEEKISIERYGVSVPTQDPDLLLIDGTAIMETASEGLSWVNDLPIKWRARINRKKADFTVEVFRS
ncbi:DUF3237 domain-containing protein [Kroppenstedtia pulmonis]|uniref:DUF3237 domain-containing protein n=1 Tax=Kroppenstedtia pulmonis TaxID=1380685 RepID=A0A7D3Y316_9BACL|nr:hypothetical protein [Kroppenstedtia pulmonis]QKG83265.1 DUF3237 domain-containing protein [Kroppenstedtia pulmonis]